MSGFVRPQTLVEVAVAAKDGRPAFADAVKEFMYSFARMDRVKRQAAIAGEPPLVGDQVVDAYLAAVADFLAGRMRLPCPHWAATASRALEKPWYAGNMERLKPVLLAESPSAFRIRNLFVSANVLDRPGLVLAVNEFKGPSHLQPGEHHALGSF